MVGVRISTTKTQTSNWAHGVTIRNLSSLLAAMVVGNSPPSEISKFVRDATCSFGGKVSQSFRFLSGFYPAITWMRTHGKEPHDLIPLVVGSRHGRRPFQPRVGEVWPLRLGFGWGSQRAWRCTLWIT